MAHDEYEERMVARYLEGWETFVLDRRTGDPVPVLFHPQDPGDLMPWITLDGTARHASHEVGAVKPKAKVQATEPCATCGQSQPEVSHRLNLNYRPWNDCAGCLIGGMEPTIVLLERWANEQGRRTDR